MFSNYPMYDVLAGVFL